MRRTAYIHHYRKQQKEIGTILTDSHNGLKDPSILKDLIVASLDNDKALDIEVIDLTNQSAIGDYMIVASGTSSRQIVAMAEKLEERLRERGHRYFHTEGMGEGNWVVCDLGDVIIHLFRPEVRAFYNIEEMWRMSPSAKRDHASFVTA